MLSKRQKTYDLTLDRVAAILVLCAGTILIAVSVSLKHYSIHLPLIITISALLYLIIERRLSQSKDLAKFREVKKVRLISHMVFLISFSLMIGILWSNLYYRPPLYFVLLSVATAAIILDIFCSNEAKDSQHVFALLKIIVLSLSVYAGIYYQFPGIYGSSDPLWHNQWIQETVRLGHITPGEYNSNWYYIYPIFTIACAITHVLTSLSIYDSIFITVAGLMAVSTVFVFLIGRSMIGVRAGLLVALILSFTPHIIQRATSIMPMSLGWCFFVAIIYLVFSRTNKQLPRSSSILLLLLSIALIYTHAIASLAVLLSLVTIFITVNWHRKSSSQGDVKGIVTFFFLAFFGVAMLFKWMQSGIGSPAILDVSMRNLIECLQFESRLYLTTQPNSGVPYLVTLLNNGGYLVLLFLGLIGGLIFLRTKSSDGRRTALASITLTLLAVVYVSEFLSIEAILPWRWYIFIYAPLSILAIQGLFSIANLMKSAVGHLSLVMLVIVPVIFMMTTSGTANGESPMVFNGAKRLGYTQSEITAIETLSDIGCGQPQTDGYYSEIFPYIIGFENHREMLKRDNTVFIRRNYYLHQPNWDERYFIQINKGINKGERWLDSERVLILDYIKEEGIDKGALIYNNGNVEAYRIWQARQKV